MKDVTQVITSSFQFTTLTEPPNNTETLPAGFNANMAWLLGQCCNLTYQQYDTATPPDVSSLTLGTGVTITTSLLAPFSVSEANGPQSTMSDPGDYTTVPAGFAVVVSQSGLPSPFPAQFIVVALRGTQTWDEWISDAEAYPDVFASGNLGLALVHSGIYGFYVTGSFGVSSQTPLDPLQSNRAPGSIAYQVAGYFAQTSLPANLPIYVTGHSLGGALAPMSAWDVASILKPAGSTVSMYSLAAPRCILGFAFPSLSVLATIGTSYALQPYQAAVPNSFRIVHACDIVPVLPPSTIVSNTSLSVTTAHVTDSYSIGNQNYPGLAQNVVTFCAQTRDLGGNHSCLLTYLPYVQWLASVS